MFQDVAQKYEERSMMDPDYIKWIKHTSRLRSKYMLPSQSTPWTSKMKLTGVPDSERMRNSLDCCYSILRNENPGMSTHMLVQRMWDDISQGAQRTCFSRGKCPTVAKSTLLYSFQEQTTISAHATMRAQGGPSNYARMHEFTELDCKDLSGDQFSVIISGLFMKVIYTLPQMPWWKSLDGNSNSSSSD